jgi:hypothetical protein
VGIVDAPDVVDNGLVSSTTANATTSTTDIADNALTTILPQGQWMVDFSGDVSLTPAGFPIGYVSLYYSGALIGHTQRRVQCNASGLSLASIAPIASVHTQALITSNGTASIQVMFRASAQTITLGPRSLKYTRVGP